MNEMCKKFLEFIDLGGNLTIHLFAPHTRLQSKIMFLQKSISVKDRLQNHILNPTYTSSKCM